MKKQKNIAVVLKSLNSTVTELDPNSEWGKAKIFIGGKEITGIKGIQFTIHEISKMKSQINTHKTSQK